MIRRPAVAGAFYPADPQELVSIMEMFLSRVPEPPEIPPVAVVAPHAGYIYSGPVAAHSFKQLLPLRGRNVRVFLMGPSHYVPFQGVSTGSYSYWKTPLGLVPVDEAKVKEILTLSDIFIDANEPLIREHSLEVEVPFLQYVLGEFKLVPLVFGFVDPFQVAPLILRVIEPGDIIVVSTDLSHYHPDVIARSIDARTIEMALKGDTEGVLNAEACGSHPWATLVEMANIKGWKPTLLAYATSADTSGDTSRVVGYAAFRYDEQEA